MLTRALQTRLLLGTALGMAVVLLLSGLLLYVLIGRALWNSFNETLASKLRALAAMAESEDGEVELDFKEADFSEFKPSERAEYYQVWADDGSVLARSPSLQGQDLQPVDGTLDNPVFRLARLPDGRPGCLVGARFAPRPEKAGPFEKPLTITMVIGRETAQVAVVLTQLRSSMVLVGLLSIGTSAAVLIFLVRRGLRPARQLAARIAAVQESDLDQRIICTNTPSELQPIVDRLNNLLTRLDNAFQSERRFNADVAHELRTPLAGARSLLEVALSRDRDTQAYRDTLSQCLGINLQMHRMVENLLSLARADSGQLEILAEQVDLTALLRDCWQPFANQAAEKQLRVHWRLLPACPLVSDRVKLVLVLQNILSNAVTYGDRGGQIGIDLSRLNENIELTVTNTAGQIRPTDLEHVFDRFWRGDASRQIAGHCGLGLALCKTLMGRLNGKIRAELTNDNTFAVILCFDSPPLEKNPLSDD